MCFAEIVKIIKNIEIMQKINIIGEIDDKAVERFIEDVKALDYEDGVLIQFDSNGGFLDAGYSIASIIMDLKQRTNVVATNIGNVMSAATLPYVVCSYRIFDTTKGEFLIHNASLEYVSGDGDYLMKAAISTLQTDNDLADFYSAVSGKDPELILSRMSENKSMDGWEIKYFNFADEIIEG